MGVLFSYIWWYTSDLILYSIETGILSRSSDVPVPLQLVSGVAVDPWIVLPRLDDKPKTPRNRNKDAIELFYAYNPVDVPHRPKTGHHGPKAEVTGHFALGVDLGLPVWLRAGLDAVAISNSNTKRPISSSNAPVTNPTPHEKPLLVTPSMTTPCCILDKMPARQLPG